MYVKKVATGSVRGTTTEQSLCAARRDLAAAIRDAGERTGFFYLTSFDSILPRSTIEVVSGPFQKLRNWESIFLKRSQFIGSIEIATGREF